MQYATRAEVEAVFALMRGRELKSRIRSFWFRWISFALMRGRELK